MKSQNVRLQFWHWEEITHLFALLALFCVAATGALLVEAQRSSLWAQDGFPALLGIMAVVSLLMILLGVASGVHGERLRQHRDR